ncbi:MAG: helicase-exonuclease AddAB subunit AddA [Lachnospiraceae bacterium]|nr:helicase-exonuclease AddAB subunit AddA [Lachnospiraceae bacterium]
MAVKWTKKQLDVINTTDRNILVSAAAGSGKTAVLVERIIQKILDKTNPVNVDELLVVTFTKAAASEMRERVLKSLDAALKEDPDNEHLQRQQSYIHNAKITTIDSFCSGIVKEYFDRIELDPNTRIVDAAEITMLQNDILNDMLEKKFEEESDSFISLVDKYSNHRSTDKINSIISILYNNAVSHVNPKKWLNECRESYSITSVEEMEKTVWMKKLKFFIAKEIESINLSIEEGIDISRYCDAFVPYYKDMTAIKAMFAKVDCNAGFDEIGNALGEISFSRLPNVKGEYDDLEKERYKEIRNKIKKRTEDLVKNYFSQSINEVLSDIMNCSEAVNELIDLTISFYDEFVAAKKEKCIMDFADQEHYALEILRDYDENGCGAPSQVALEIGSKFREIMIDEYQDSNEIQEEILTSVSKGFGVNNVFMVGDVKQSIYKFRLANPQLFIDKFDTYKEELTSDECKIILDCNFRSRSNIIDSVNFIFSRIMRRELGGIEYDEGNAMSFGADYYPDLPKSQNNDTELLLVEGEGNENEISVIADEIKKITSETGDFKVSDGAGGLRTPKYNDIVILLRSVKSRGDEYVEELGKRGIPAYCESRTGFYDAMEVKLILDYLRIIDNPLQDIPLVAVMRSDIFGFTSNELAKIKEKNDLYYYYESLLAYCENADDELLVGKVKDFIDEINYLRKQVSYTGVYDMISLILSRSGYEEFVFAMPNGVRRVKNIDILKEKAKQFDDGVFKGIFNFVRYIEKIKELKVDEGEASPYNEQDNIVRIMTFHKSKGLQFPVVFVSSLATKFNNADVKAEIISHDSIGIGVEYIDEKLRFKKTTIIKNVIKNMIKEENYAEYIRFLYVAMTRAQEKMYLTASCSEMKEKMDEFRRMARSENGKLDYSRLMQSNCFMDWICMALNSKGFKENAKTIIRYIGESEIEESDIKGLISTMIKREELVELDPTVVYDENIKELIEGRMRWNYRFKEEANLPSKLSVTDIKKMSVETDEDAVVHYKSEAVEKIPLFMQEEKETFKLTGAERGTAYHRIFELFDFEMEPTKENIANMIANLIECGKISKLAGESVDVEDLFTFTRSSLYSRMKKAFDNNLLFRERGFLMGIPANEIKALGLPDVEEVILVQGIIDVCFVEDGNYIIADYKTDKVSRMEQLVEKYQPQLDSYQYAINKLDNINVSEKIIYSVTLGDEINC